MSLWLAGVSGVRETLSDRVTSLSVSPVLPVGLEQHAECKAPYPVSSVPAAYSYIVDTVWFHALASKSILHHRN